MSKRSKADIERARWLEDRKTYLGATEVAAVLGLHPFMSAHSVWLSKIGLSEEFSNIPMRAGIHMEPFIASEFTRGEYKGGDVFKSLKLRLIKSKTYRHKEYPFLACNPDREVQGIRYEGKRLRVGLECKRVGHWASRNFGQDGSDQVPEHYLIQIMWQMLIGKFDIVILAALIDDREIRTYSYTFNPEFSSFAHVFPKEDATKVFNFCVRWWGRHVGERVEPNLSHTDCDTDYAKQERASYENGRLGCPDETIDEVCAELKSLLPEESKIGDRVKAIKNQIRHFMVKEQISDLETQFGMFTYRTNAKGVPVFNHPFKGANA